MKATEIKYLLLLQGLAANAKATQAELAGALDVPPSLVNRYIRRLAGWEIIRKRGANGRNPSYELAAKGQGLLDQASWQLVDFAGEMIECLGKRAVARLRDEAVGRGWRRAVLYGATPLAELLRWWAADAGLEVAGVCDEERQRRGILRLDDLAGVGFDCVILCDWRRAEDRVLGALLAHYAPVINLFVSGGRAVPRWR